MNLPQVVSRDDWRIARQQLLAKEKAATRAYDALNAERRMLPMITIDKRYVFEGPNGAVSLSDLFDGRRSAARRTGGSQPAAATARHKIGCAITTPMALLEQMRTLLRERKEAR
jgi:hypothetical protein